MRANVCVRERDREMSGILQDAVKIEGLVILTKSFGLFSSHPLLTKVSGSRETNVHFLPTTMVRKKEKKKAKKEQTMILLLFWVMDFFPKMFEKYFESEITCLGHLFKRTFIH